VLGRLDISYATSAMSGFNVLPREEHLKTVKRILAFLKTFPKVKVIFDIAYPDHSIFPGEHSNLMEFYPDVEDEIPNYLPTSK
jgi:hypothetical protein